MPGQRTQRPTIEEHQENFFSRRAYLDAVRDILAAEDVFALVTSDIHEPPVRSAAERELRGASVG